MLETFCGRFHLNTGGVIIGWLGVIGSVIGIAISSMVLNRLDDIVKYFEASSENIDILRLGILIVACTYLVLSAITLISSTVLIVGTVKERHLLLIPWLIVSGIVLFFCCIQMGHLIAIGIVGTLPLGTFVVTLIISLLELVLLCYVWCVIYSLYKQIQAKYDLQKRITENPDNVHSCPSM